MYRAERGLSNYLIFMNSKTDPKVAAHTAADNVALGTYEDDENGNLVRVITPPSMVPPPSPLSIPSSSSISSSSSSSSSKIRKSKTNETHEKPKQSNKGALI